MTKARSPMGPSEIDELMNRIKSLEAEVEQLREENAQLKKQRDNYLSPI